MYQTPYFSGLISQPNCESCPLRYQRKVFPDGPIPALIAFVGEGPGRTEEQQGKGFVGATGQILWRLCEQFGLHRSQVWVSNAALCRPKDITLNTGAVIPAEHTKRWSGSACRTRLLEELILVGARVIVPIGALALASTSTLIGPSIFAYRGSRIDTDLPKLLDEVRRGVAA